MQACLSCTSLPTGMRAIRCRSGSSRICTVSRPMGNRIVLRITLVAMSVALSAAQQSPPKQESPANGILRMSEAEQVAYTNSILDRGMQVDETETLGTLV